MPYVFIGPDELEQRLLEPLTSGKLCLRTVVWTIPLTVTQPDLSS